MRRESAFLAVLFATVVCSARVRSADVDDAYRFVHIGQALERGARIAVVRIDDERILGSWRAYRARITRAIRGVRVGDTVAFTELNAATYPVIGSETFSRGPFPEMAAGLEYLVLFGDHRPSDDWRSCPRPAEYPAREWYLGSMSTITIRTDLHSIHEILPKLQQLIDIRDTPTERWPATLRAWAFSNLETKHKWLRYVLHRELAYNSDLYRDISKQDATRLAYYSESMTGYERFNVLEQLARHGPMPMDDWFIRALSRGAPGKIDPHDTRMVIAYSDSIDRVAEHLSVDSFWPMIERPTRGLNPFVEAFARKGDPRLVPFILQKLEPGRAAEGAAGSLQYYTGRPEVARALIELVRRTNDLGSDDNARRAVTEGLRHVGTSDALAEAGRLAAISERLKRMPPHPPAVRRPEDDRE